MERMRDGMRLGCLGFWLNCCLLAGCLGLWLGGFARLGSLARGFARLGSLARLADIWTAPGSLARFTSKKFLRFLISQELFFTQSQSRPTETLFTAQSGLTRELLTSKFHIDPRTSLLTLPREGDVPLAVGHHKIILYQSLHISHIQWIFLRLIS